MIQQETVIQPASAKMQKRRSGMIIATEKIVFIGIALLATGIAVGVFQDAIFGVTEFADIQVQNFETQRNGDRLTVTATIKNVGNTPIDSIVLTEYTAGDLSIRQDATVTDGSPAGNYGNVFVTGRIAGNTCSTDPTSAGISLAAAPEQLDIAVTTGTGTTCAAPTNAATTILINGISWSETTQRGIDGKGSIVFRMTINADSDGIDITDSTDRNDPTTIAFIYMVGESEQTGKTAHGKIKGN